MKNVFFILALVIFSCGDDDNVDPQRQFDFGSITALKNGEHWSAEIHGFDNNGQWDYFGIDSRVYNQQGFERENFVVLRLPKAILLDEIIPICGNNCNDSNQGIFGTSTVDGDVNCDIYNIVEELSSENQIEITEYDSESKEFRGTFRAVFAIDENREKCNPNAPDTIRFTNGEFHSKITR